MIYPSDRNTEKYYQKFFDHSQKCYEQFTGSYSKKKDIKVNEPEKEKFVIKPQPKVVQSPTKYGRIGGSEQTTYTEQTREYIN